MVLEILDIFLGDNDDIYRKVHADETAVDLLGGFAAVDAGRHHDQQVQVTVRTELIAGGGAEQDDFERVNRRYDPADGTIQSCFK
jgi:hypothetical protein